MHCHKETPASRDEEDSHSRSVEEHQHDTQSTASKPVSSRLLRSCNMNRNQLSYDLKYHPIDEYIRPMNAAKRRSACDDNTDNEHSASHEQVGPVQKRRKTSISVKPPRRTTRHICHPKTAYDMKMHPQDAELHLLSTEEMKSDDNAPESSRDSSTEPRKPTASVNKESVIATRTDELMTETAYSTILTNSTPQSVEYGLDDGVMEKGQACNDFQKSPHATGVGFDVYTEVWEDVPATEATTASPFQFEHNDQENLSSTSQPESSFGTLDTVHLTPSSLHRQTSEDSQASHRLSLLENVFNYGLQSKVDPYGFRVGETGSNGEFTQASPTL